MSETELKNCPFCGGAALLDGHAMEWWVKCVDCDAMVHLMAAGPQHAAASWNRRATDDRDLSDALVEHVNYTSELQQQLDDIRRALRGYHDSDLASLAGTMMSQRRLQAQALEPDLYYESVEIEKLVRSILDDEPAPDELHPSTIAALEAGEFITEDELRDSLPPAYEPAPEPTEREALAAELIAWAAKWYVDTSPGPDPHRGHTEYACHYCDAILKRSWEGDPTGPLDESNHATDCAHERAKRLTGGDDE